ASYLRWYGLEQQVVFRGTRDTPEALRLLADPAVPMERLATPPLATIPVGLTPELRALLRIVPDTSGPLSLAGGTLVPSAPPPVPPAGVTEQVLEGATLFRRAAAGVRDAPAEHRGSRAQVASGFANSAM